MYLEQMESDVELDFEGSDRAESGAASEVAPSESEYSYGMTCSQDNGGSCPRNSYTSVSRGGSFDHEVGPSYASLWHSLLYRYIPCRCSQYSSAIYFVV